MLVSFLTKLQVKLITELLFTYLILLAMQSGYTPISATLVIDDTNPFVGHCSLDITPDGTYNALIYLKSQGDDKTCNCKVRLVWIKNQ